MQHGVDASYGRDIQYQQSQPPPEQITFPSGGGYVVVRKEITTSAQPPTMEQRVFTTSGESRTALEAEALRALQLNNNDGSSRPAEYASFSPQQQQRYQGGQPQYSANSVRDDAALWQSGALSPPQNAHCQLYQDQRSEAPASFFSPPLRHSRSLSPTQLKKQQKLTENYYLKRYYEPTWVDLINDVQNQGGVIEANSQPPSQQTIYLSGLPGKLIGLPSNQQQQQQYRQPINHQPQYNNEVDELSQKPTERTVKQSSYIIRERIVENPLSDEYHSQTTWNQEQQQVQPNQQQQIVHRQFVNQPSQQQFISQSTLQQHNMPPTKRYENEQQQGHLSQPNNEQNSYVIYQREVARPTPTTITTTQTTHQYYVLDQQVPPLQYDQQQQNQQYIVLQNQVSPQQKHPQLVGERQLHEELLQESDGQRILLRNPDQQTLSRQQNFVQQIQQRSLPLQQQHQQPLQPQQQQQLDGQEYTIIRNHTHVFSPQQKVVNQQVKQKVIQQRQTESVVQQHQQSNEIPHEQPQQQMHQQSVVQQPIQQDKQQVHLQGRGQQPTFVQQSRQQQQFLQKQQAQAAIPQQQAQQVRVLQKQPIQQQLQQEQHLAQQTLQRQQAQPITENYNQQYQAVQPREQQQPTTQSNSQLLMTVSQQQQSQRQIADQPGTQHEPQEQRAPFGNQQHQLRPGQVKVVSQHTAKEEFYPRREPNNPFAINNNNDYFYVKRRNFESDQSANFGNNNDVVAIPSGPPPTFTTSFGGAEQCDAISYRKLAPRSKSANPRSYQSPMNTFSCGGMDFIDHNNPVPSEFENIIIESGSGRRSRRDDLPLRRPGDHFGLDFSTHPAAADANIVISEDYRGYAPLQPRQHWKFSADPEAPILNNFEVEVVDDGTSHLIGDTLSNQKVFYERPLTEEEKRTFGTAFAPPAGFKPEHRTFISPPKEPEPVCYSLSVKKEKTLSPAQQNKLPTSTPESLGQEQYKQRGVSGNNVATNNNNNSVVNGNQQQQQQGQQQSQSWYVDGNREIMKTEPNWSKNVNLRTRAWEMESVNQNRPAIVKRPAWVKSGGRASSVSAPQTTYGHHNAREQRQQHQQSYYSQRDQPEGIVPNNHHQQQQQQWQQNADLNNNNNYAQDDSNENFI